MQVGCWLSGHCILLPEGIIVVMVRNKSKEQKEQWAAWPLCKKISAFSKPTPDAQGQSHVLICISYPHGSSGNWKRWESYRGTASCGGLEMIEAVQLWEQRQMQANTSKFQGVIKGSKIISQKVSLRGSFSIAIKGSPRALTCYLWLLLSNGGTPASTKSVFEYEVSATSNSIICWQKKSYIGNWYSSTEFCTLQ